MDLCIDKKCSKNLLVVSDIHDTRMLSVVYYIGSNVVLVLV